MDLGFGEPVDWYPEAEDELTATVSFIQVVRLLVDQGHQVDCVDIWNSAPDEDIERIDVNLNIISDEQFRFFENYYFNFTAR